MLTRKEIEAMKDYLQAYFANPYVTDLSGDDWEKIFALSIGVTPPKERGIIGQLDVVRGDYGWSTKTVKTLHGDNRVVIITGRNNIVYTYDARDLSQYTTDQIGEMVLGIHNERVHQFKRQVRFPLVCVLVRQRGNTEFIYFEEEAKEYDYRDFEWKWNEPTKRIPAMQNIHGFQHDGKKKFIWQSNGSQFSIYYDVPANATRFRIDKFTIPIDRYLELTKKEIARIRKRRPSLTKFMREKS